MGKFVLKKSKNDGFVFNLKATNGQVIATSQVYSTEATCMNGIESVKKNSAAANIEDQTKEGFEVQKHPKFEVYTDKSGEFRFRLKATNGEIIVTGQAYKRHADVLNGIDSIKRNAPDAEVVKEEE